MTPQQQILERFRHKKILVWGDLILDEYIYTSTSRVSREAPVLVTELESKEFKAGGAGNVVMNIKTLGATPIPVALIGSDLDGQILRGILKENGITTDYLIELEDFRTPKKSRILSGSVNTKKQQILRIDTLNKGEIGEKPTARMQNLLKELSIQVDALIISDYLYETVKPGLLKALKKEGPGCKAIIDSRNNLLDFKDVTIATPNELEIKKMFPRKIFNQEEDFLNAGKDLMNILDAQGIVLKRGHKGMIVFERGKSPEKVQIHGSSEIVDGTGAGDTVISVVSLALSAGAGLYSSASLANMAAGLVVMKEGAYPVSIRELRDELT